MNSLLFFPVFKKEEIQIFICPAIGTEMYYDLPLVHKLQSGCVGREREHLAATLGLRQAGRQRVMLSLHESRKLNEINL